MLVEKMIWEKENWIPGVLSKRQLKSLIDCGFLLRTNPQFDRASDHSSLDLHLSDEGYEMKGSIKPCGGEYRDFYENPSLASKLTPVDGEYELIHNKTYIFKIKESFSPLVRSSIIYAQATAKSTVGRVDVVARLIVDGMHVYEYMDPNDITSGDMFLEITPITFNVKVKPDISLSQIRFFVDKPSKSIIPNESIAKIVLNGSKHHDDGTLSIDLNNEVVGGLSVAAFSAIGANDDNNELVTLWGKENLEPSKFWKCIPSTASQGKQRLTIEPDKFYILRSKERISLPKGVAVYCQAMDETLGEMRIHYAGFAHPFFGINRKDQKTGTPLIFEVRGHNVKVNLTDGEKLAKLVFYRMSEDSVENTLNSQEEEYNNQELRLSKFFKKWPEKLSRDDGTNMVKSV